MAVVVLGVKRALLLIFFSWYTYPDIYIPKVDGVFCIAQKDKRFIHMA